MQTICDHLEAKKLLSVTFCEMLASYMGQIYQELYLVKICNFFQSLDNQYSKTVDSGGLNFPLLFWSHRVAPVDITFRILLDIRGPPGGGPPVGPGGPPAGPPAGGPRMADRIPDHMSTGATLHSGARLY